MDFKLKRLWAFNFKREILSREGKEKKTHLEIRGLWPSIS